jgi:hypothetical protein
MNLSPWLGIPYKIRGRDRSGVDCFGLAFLVYREAFDLDLPNYSWVHSLDRLECEAAFAEGALSWIEVPLSEARWPDVVSIIRDGIACHCGLFVPGRPVARLLHADLRQLSGAPRLDQLPDPRDRVGKCYRHPALA